MKHWRDLQMVAPATQSANTKPQGAVVAAAHNVAEQAKSLAEQAAKDVTTAATNAGQQLAKQVDVKHATQTFARNQMKANLRQFHSLLELSRNVKPLYNGIKKIVCAGNIITPEQVDAFCDNPDSLADNLVDKLFEKIQEPAIANKLNMIPGYKQLSAPLLGVNSQTTGTDNSNTGATVNVTANKTEATKTVATESSSGTQQGFITSAWTKIKGLPQQAKKLIDSVIHDPRDEAARNEAIAKGGLKAKWLKLPQGARKGATYAGAGLAGLVVLRVVLGLVGFALRSVKKLVLLGLGIFAGKKVMNKMSGGGKATGAKKSGGMMSRVKKMLHKGAHDAITNATENTPTGQIAKAMGLDKKAKQLVNAAAA